MAEHSAKCFPCFSSFYPQNNSIRWTVSFPRLADKETGLNHSLRHVAGERGSPDLHESLARVHTQTPLESPFLCSKTPWNPLGQLATCSPPRPGRPLCAPGDQPSQAPCNSPCDFCQQAGLSNALQAPGGRAGLLTLPPLKTQERKKYQPREKEGMRVQYEVR